MSDKIKIKFQQTIHALDVLAYNQRLLRDNNINENDEIEYLDLLFWVKRYVDQRKIVEQLENQLKCVTSKTKSQSQQIHDQRKRRLNSSNRAIQLHKTIEQIYDLINYHGQHTSPIDQLHYIKRLCEDKLKKDKSLSSDEDDDELDSHNCTIDDDQNESLIIPPRVVLPQSSTKKHLLNNDDDDEKNLHKIHSSPKRFRYDNSQEFRTKTIFECYNSTQPFTISTDIQMIDHSSSSSTINSTKTESTSSIEQTLPLTTITPSKMPVITHRFISKKIFKPETCFVCFKRINFGSVSYRCSYCSQSSHVNCKENANSDCKYILNKAMLPPYSPKTPNIPTLKTSHHPRMANSEPRKTIISSSNTLTIQRRLPFERMILLK
ncbi:unnamed protein product [Adineta steineri]|uniref:Phorbol-ester/DAG-type domain-containing protein n=1 Tax=Adineta steineri TaxID=433720 RepID=A0A814BR48_9BILA|nr:unnamed protein product [Adineta steineri]CAF1091393.1 unnamed protein product [Adineta steineri]CAF3705104.1 unnamed protein product [Adineta steineri]CAF3831465.1 unnamed protein product [Adineta steineri]